MGKESYALLTGLFVLTLGSALILIGIWLGQYGDERDAYVVITRASVSGLNPESTVLYRGVQAGKVSEIKFDPKDSRNILVRIEINKGMPITRGTFAKLRVQGLTGLAQIELGDSGENPAPLITSRDNPSQIPLQPSLVDRLADSGGNMLLRSEDLVARLTELLNDENRTHMRQILANLDNATARLVGLEEHLDQTLVDIRGAAVRFDGAGEALRAASATAQKTLPRFNSAATEIEKAAQRMQTLAENANTLALSGKTATDNLTRTTLPMMNVLLKELQSTVARVGALSGQLQKEPQSLLYGPVPPEPGPGESGYQEPQP